MIKSPWEQATALVTTEREGVRTHRRFALTSTQQTITVPITEADIPNVFVSVLLVKGRTQGRHARRRQRSRQAVVPSRLRRAEGRGRDASASPSTAKADKDEYRPANKAKVDGRRQGRRRASRRTSEVTLWAVDYGVLSLTGFQTPDVLKSVYVEKALQVITTTAGSASSAAAC